jgi:hypothetical protein
VVQARQVSTQPEKVQAFFQQLTRERLHDGESFVAVLEVCGFNDARRADALAGDAARATRRPPAGPLASNTAGRGGDTGHTCDRLHRPGYQAGFLTSALASLSSGPPHGSQAPPKQRPNGPDSHPVVRYTGSGRRS